VSLGGRRPVADKSASFISAAVANRSAGAFCMPFKISASSSAGTPLGSRRDGGSGSSCSCLVITPSAESARNGTSPTTI
jgi:hypothetical protein